jgi:ABC-type nitrate/sulfonate/bicarbonate transport system permease component
MIERFLQNIGITTNRGKARAYGTLSLMSLLILWILATSVFQWIEPRVLPSPAKVVSQFYWILTEPFSGLRLPGHILSSLERWGWGVFFGMVLGIPVGVFFAWNPWFKTFVNPVFELIHFIPPFAYIPLAVLWFGASTATQAMVVFVAAFPAFVINSQLGVAQVDKIYVDAARVFGAGQFATLRRVVIPAAAPSIYTGLRIAISNGWMALVGAELVVGKVGLGFMIAQGQENASVATIFVGVITIGCLGVLIDTIIQRSEHRILPWRKNVVVNQG